MAGKSVGRPKTTIEIPLPSIKKYTRGSGPPPPPITLAPPRDSTAYIIDQYVLPPLKDTTPDSRRRIYYHIGFTDIPAARLLVPCDKALDYVSPREVEDWEYEALEFKEAEKAIEAEKKRKSQGQAPVKKKPGRPPKARPNDPVLNAPAEPVISQQEGDVLLAKQEAVGGPSLATPQKRKRAEIPTLDDSDEAAIRLQLQNDSAAVSEVGDSGTDLEGYDSADPLADDVGNRYPSYSRASSSVSAQQPVAGPSKPTVISLGDTAKPAPRPSLSVASTPGRIHPMFARSIDAGRSSVSGHGTQKGASQNGVGHPLGFGGKNAEAAVRASPSKDSSTRQFKAVPKTAVNPLPSHPAHAKPIAFTPLAVPIAISKPIVTSDSLSKQQNESSSARKRGKDEQSRPSKKQKSKPQVDEPAASWVVKELLDDQWVTEFGVKVHKYLVLWEGDWPPDQNPTWEPEENIEDESLIKKYLKKKQAGVLKPPKKTQRSMLSYLSQPQYSSVAEAFEGDIDELQPEAAAVIPDSDSDDGGDELLVTEEPVAVSKTQKNGKGKISSFTSFDSKLDQYQKSFPK